MAANGKTRRNPAYSGSNTLRETTLNTNERRYLFAVDYGNFAVAKSYIDFAEELEININCVDPWGRNALVIAIENENIQMLKLLLEKNIKFGDALLHAIESEHIQAIEIMLEASQKSAEQMKRKKVADLLGESTSASFSSDITPLILACHVDNFYIIRMLLEIGATIPQPHDVDCRCVSCIRERREDALKHSLHRFNAYKALSSPSLICMTSRDPILTAFELSYKLWDLSFREFEFKEQYEELAARVRSFAVDVLNQSRGSMELHVILNHDAGGEKEEMKSDFEWDSELKTYIFREGRLPRLRLAINYQQRVFVANPRCQHTLSALWLEGLDGYRQMSTMNQLVTSLTIASLFPLWVGLHIMMPNTKFGRFITYPYVKFLCHTASYLLFLLVLIAESIRIQELISQKTAESVVRAPAPSIPECAILLYLFGWFMHEVSTLYQVGHRSFVSNPWNILNLTALSFFALWFGLRVGAWIEVDIEISEALFTVLPREEWDGWDPTIVAEGAFTVASIVVFMRIMHLFTLFQFLGPLQMAIEKVLLDIGKFFILYFWVVFAFACGITQMYWYYAALYVEECENGKITDPLCWKLQQNWGNIFNIFQTLYWFLLNHVKMQNLWVYDGLSFSNFLVRLLFGIYRCIAHVVLVTLLIAMMNHSYSLSMGGFGPEDMGEEENEEEEIVEQTLEQLEIEREEEASEHTMTLTEKLLNKLKEGSAQSDMQWKFARAKMFLRYANNSNNLPIPFNLIPNFTRHATTAFIFARRLAGFDDAGIDFEDRMNLIHRRKVAILERQQQYESIISKLIKRYQIRKQKLDSHKAVHETDFNELKQGINSFRFDMMDILRSNKFVVTEDLVRRQGNRLRRRKQRAQGVSITAVNQNVTVIEPTDANGNGEGDDDGDNPDSPTGNFSRTTSGRASNSNRQTRYDVMERQLSGELGKIKSRKDDKSLRKSLQKKKVTFNAKSDKEKPSK